MRRMIPYSVDITGNFVYSPQLIEARKQVQEGLLNAAQLLEIENKEIQHIVDTCKQIGLKCVTDANMEELRIVFTPGIPKREVVSG